MSQEPPSSPTPPGPPIPPGPAYGDQPTTAAPQGNPYDPAAAPPYGQEGAAGAAQAAPGAPYFPPGPYYEGAVGHRVARPGTVVAGAVIAIVQSSLAGLVFLLATLAAGSLANEFGLEDIGGAIIVIGLVFAALCVVAIVAAARSIAGSQAWRITLVVFAALTALCSLLGIIGGLSESEGGAVVLYLIWGIGAGLTITFMFINNANAWFSQRSQ